MKVFTINTKSIWSYFFIYEIYQIVVTTCISASSINENCPSQSAFSSNVPTLINFDVGSPTLYALAEGDIMLGGFFPVHSRRILNSHVRSNDTLRSKRCGELNFQYGIQAVEAALFAIDYVNTNLNMPCNLKLGLYGLDTCQSPDFAFGEMLPFVQNLLQRTSFSNFMRFSTSPQHTIKQERNRFAHDIMGQSINEQISSKKFTSTSVNQGTNTVTFDASNLTPTNVVRGTSIKSTGGTKVETAYESKNPSSDHRTAPLVESTTGKTSQAPNQLFIPSDFRTTHTSPSPDTSKTTSNLSRKTASTTSNLNIPTNPSQSSSTISKSISKSTRSNSLVSTSTNEPQTSSSISTKSTSKSFTSMGVTKVMTISPETPVTSQQMHTISTGSIDDKTVEPACISCGNKTFSPFDNMVGVLGAADSGVSIAIHNFLKLFRIPQISYQSTSPELSDKDKYNYFLRTAPSDKSMVYVIAKILKKFKWLYVSVIYDDSDYGKEAFSAFKDQATKDYIKIGIERRIETQLMTNLNHNHIFDTTAQAIINVTEIKVVVTFMDVSTVVCLFDAVRRHPRRDVWSKLIWVGTETWGTRKRVELDVGNKELLARSVIVTSNAFIPPNFIDHLKNLQITNTTRNPWLKLYFYQLCNCSEQQSCNSKQLECIQSELQDYTAVPYIHYIIDAVLAFAHAIKAIIERQPFNPINSALSGDLLMMELENIQFPDSAGQPFAFVNKIDGPPLFTVFSYNPSDSWIEVGKFNTPVSSDVSSGTLNLNSAFVTKVENTFPISICHEECSPGNERYFSKLDFCWKCRDCPEFHIVIPSNDPHMLYTDIGPTNCSKCDNDSTPNANRTACTPMMTNYMSPSKPVGITIISLCILGMIITFSVAIVYIVHRNTPVIKASGRETCSILLFGIFISYLFPVPLTFKPNKIICTLFFIAPGFCVSVCYAAILARTNLIARIFRSDGQHAGSMKFASPKSQLYIMAFLIATAMLILTCLTVVNPPHVHVAYDKTSVPTRNLLCYDKTSVLLLILGLLFPSILLIVSTIYAFKIRKTPDGFNETQSLCFVNYINCALIILVFGAQWYWSNESLSINSGVPTSFFLILSATSHLCGIFMPKLYVIFFRPLKNTPEAVMVRTRTLSQLSLASKSSPRTVSCSTCSELLNVPNKTTATELESQKYKKETKKGNPKSQRYKSETISCELKNEEVISVPSFKSQKSVSFSMDTTPKKKSKKPNRKSTVPLASTNGAIEKGHINNTFNLEESHS